MTDKKSIRMDILRKLLSPGAVLTRPELVKLYDIRPATLFAIIDEIKDEGIIIEPERKTLKTGRKASPLKLNPDFGCFIGVELHTAYSTATLINSEGSPLASASVQTKGTKDDKKCFAEITQVLEKLKADSAPQLWTNIKSAGFADPGLVNTQEGISVKAVNINNWANLRTREWFKENFGLDTLTIPANSARTYMEYKQFPEPPGSIFHIELDQGIGAGFIKNGKLFSGDSFCGMEIGHISIMPDGPLCQCGNRGCLEAVVGEEGIKKKIAEFKASRVETKLDPENFSFEEFIKCVNENDKAASLIAYDISDKIGRALVPAAALLNPSVIIMSGRLTGLEKILLTTVKRILTLNCMPRAVNKLVVKISGLGRNAAASGAALLARDQFLLGDDLRIC